MVEEHYDEDDGFLSITQVSPALVNVERQKIRHCLLVSVFSEVLRLVARSGISNQLVESEEGRQNKTLTRNLLDLEARTIIPHAKTTRI